MAGILAVQVLRDNFTALESQDEHLTRCWHHQDCGGCLAAKECSWCPFSWSCVPNSHKIPLLAPAYDENICPHWAERWEIRTQPLGCQVSTITSLTAIVTIFSTITVIILAVLVGVGIVRLRRHFKNRPLSMADWRRRWRERFAPRESNPEQEPLLADRP